MTFRFIAAALLAMPLPAMGQPSRDGGVVAPEVAATPAAEDARPLDPAAVPARAAQARDAALSDRVAYELVRDLTTQVGPRLAGTPAEARARDWAVRRLTAMGFANVHIEPFDLPVWERGEERAEVVAPYSQRLAVTALGNSVSTGPAGLTLPVTYFRTLADLQAAPAGSLTGRIAFVDHAMTPTQDGSSYGAFGPARFVGASIASQKGAQAIVIRSAGTDHHRNPHTGGTNFANGVTPIPAGAVSLPDAELIERMVAEGRPITMRLTLTPKPIRQGRSGNVVAEVPGRDPSLPPIAIGGHLDSWDLATGAIDDGAGVAITAAAAKRLLDAGGGQRTVRLVWFGSEETGLWGGKAYAAAHGAEPHAFGAESDFGADRIWSFDAQFGPQAKPALDRLARALAPLGIGKGRDESGGGPDIGPLAALGVPALEMSQNGLRYFDIHHTPDDTFDKIDPEQIAQNVAAWTTMLFVMADAPEVLGTRVARADQNDR